MIDNISDAANIYIITGYTDLRKSWLFLILSGLATGVSWLCYYKALQIGETSNSCPRRQAERSHYAGIGVYFSACKIHNEIHCRMHFDRRGYTAYGFTSVVGSRRSFTNPIFQPLLLIKHLLHNGGR